MTRHRSGNRSGSGNRSDARRVVGDDVDRIGNDGRFSGGGDNDRSVGDRRANTAFDRVNRYDAGDTDTETRLRSDADRNRTGQHRGIDRRHTGGCDVQVAGDIQHRCIDRSERRILSGSNAGQFPTVAVFVIFLRQIDDVRRAEME